MSAIRVQDAVHACLGSARVDYWNRCDPRPLRLETGSPWGTLFWLCGGSGAAVFDTDDGVRSLRHRNTTALCSTRRIASSARPRLGCLLVSYNTLGAERVVAVYAAHASLHDACAVAYTPSDW